jgi:hypothetical protein
MSCALTTAIAWDCRTESGGIEAIYVVEYDATDTVTKASGEISVHTLVNSRAYFKWNLPDETASLSAPIQVSNENGTVAYEATLSVRLNGLTQAKINELKLAAKTRLRVIFKDNEGNYWMMGAIKGANMVESSIEIGAGLGDHKGALVQFRHREQDSINKVQSGVVSSLSLS